MLNANGVEAQASLFLVITCSAKSLPGTLVVLFVLERGQPAVLIAKEPAFVLCGWESLLYPSSDHCHKDTKAIRKLTELQPLMFFFLISVVKFTSHDLTTCIVSVFKQIIP